MKIKLIQNFKKNFNYEVIKYYIYLIIVYNRALNYPKHFIKSPIKLLEGRYQVLISSMKL